MSKDIHRVAIVVEKSFSREKLKDLSKKMHVWLLESEINQANAKEILDVEEFNQDDLLADGITTISSPSEGLSSVYLFESILDEVDEHHNGYSHNPGWSEAHIYGVKFDDHLKGLFKKFGFSTFKIVDYLSFVAKK